MRPYPQKLKAFMEILPPNTKKECQAFLGIINYFSKFSSSTADICELLCQLTSSKREWSWNATYLTRKINNSRRCMSEILSRNPAAVPGDRCIWNQTHSCPTTNQKWYNLSKDKAPDNSILRTITFVSTIPSSAERRYRNIERNALGILHGWEKFHHHCFVR